MAGQGVPMQPPQRADSGCPDPTDQKHRDADLGMGRGGMGLGEQRKKQGKLLNLGVSLPRLSPGSTGTVLIEFRVGALLCVSGSLHM